MFDFKKNIHSSLSESEYEKPEVPDGFFIKCPHCGEMLYKEDVRERNNTCYKCGYYFKMSTKRRLRLIMDKGSFKVWDKNLKGKDPLEFPDYEKKLQQIREKLGQNEAVLTGKGSIQGFEVVVCVCDGRFLMGSMGYGVGEKITCAVERATKEKLPILIVACSGGARMQEGIVSLMQMEKTSAALKRHSQAGLLYLTLLTDPTTGGVTASFAMLGDIILAEPGALIGFAGPRVIEQTIGETLPEGFQRSEYLLEHGFIDGIVERDNLRNTLAQILKLHREVNYKKAFQGITEKAKKKAEGYQREITAWERVNIARGQNRPVYLDYVREIFESFLELHGDRLSADDGAIVGGIAELNQVPVTVIGQQKGRSIKENVKRNFGMAAPSGYRKALRLMKQAEKFHRPILLFIDTPGAFCGLEAEENGQGEAIARNLYEMVSMEVPILSIVIGEGGSGGALALGVANEVWMMENATYSILSPEGFASILWKDSKLAEQAAGVMKITAKDLLSLKIIEKIIPEEVPLSGSDLPVTAQIMKQEILNFLQTYCAMSGKEQAEQRYQRFRKM
ncbi:MAG: acetyl-CoA carboxylase carboxyltransferase subunit alpha [Lachnospiraceae bacterium]